jgi:hypothetical protein
MNIKSVISQAMEFEGMTTLQALTLMDVFLQKVKSIHSKGLFIEFGTYKVWLCYCRYLCFECAGN